MAVDWTSQEFGGWRATEDSGGGGGGGSNAFVVNYIISEDRLDKTYTEIAEAFAAGKLCYIYQDVNNIYEGYGGSYKYRLIANVGFSDNATPANVFYYADATDGYSYYCESADDYPHG